MKKSFCDVCEKEIVEPYNHNVSIGAFKGKMELLVSVSVLRGGYVSSRWEDVDLCRDCRETALRIAIHKWASVKGKLDFTYHESFK